MPRMAEKIARKLQTGGTEPRLRTHSRAGSGVYSLGSDRRYTIVETESGALELEDTGQHQVGLIDIVATSNMDGVQHLTAEKKLTRNIWRALILFFVFVALVQIYFQLRLYFKYPVATNIEAEYPDTIPFPTVAVCNSNQFRLTYITGARILNRKVRKYEDLKSLSDISNSTFDEILEKTWDMDAVRFLRSAAHWKSRMILGCTWPNGTSCKLSDFKAVWTMTGLCWAINTDKHNPVQVAGSGADHALKLLLNVESYERVDACTPHFRSSALSGIKILIYNQTHVPESSQNGVNIPPGYAMDIPFKMQHRSKIAGVHCIEESETHIRARTDFTSEYNVRTCSIRHYLNEIQRICNCSMARAFYQDPEGKQTNCNVDDYFGCVQDVIKKVQHSGTNSKCLPPCQVIDYTAWQDMNRMPSSLMPSVIEEYQEEDEADVEQDDIDEETYLSSAEHDGETFSCSDSAYLDDRTVLQIKRDAHRAYEKQARYQEDIFLRSKRLILRLQNAIEVLKDLEWGWHGDDYKGIYKRLVENVTCFSDFSSKHKEFTTIMSNRAPLSEEKKASQIHFLVDEKSHHSYPNMFKTIGDVKSRYGDQVEDILKEMQTVLSIIEKMWRIFEEKSFHTTLVADLSRMDRTVQLMKQYESGHLQRRAWAEKMQSRRMKHFFDEDFYDGFYSPIIKDLDQSLSKVINELINEDWPKMEQYLEQETAVKTGAILFFENTSPESMHKFKDFLLDVHNCTTGEVRLFVEEQLKEFKKAFRELKSSYSNIFDKELPDYLENFDFGSRFVQDNFAMANIFLHQMHMERWSQDQTYSIWSLACDIGGALGLFLGLSLLTLIELLYLCIQHKFFWQNIKNFKMSDCFSSSGRKKLFTKPEVSYERTNTSVSSSTKYPIHRILNEEDMRKLSRNKQDIWGELSPYVDVNTPSDYPDTMDWPDNYQEPTEIYEKPNDSFNPPPYEHLESAAVKSPRSALERLSNIPEENSQRSDKLDHRKSSSGEKSALEDENKMLSSQLTDDDTTSEPSQLLFRGSEKQTVL